MSLGHASTDPALPARKSGGMRWRVAAQWLVLLVVLANAWAGPLVAQQWSTQTVGGNGGDELDLKAGRATDRSIGQPFGVEVAGDGRLYVTEVSHHRIWRIDLDSGAAQVVVGNGRKGYSGDGGLATDASLNEPYEIRFDREENMYFVEMQNHLIRRVDAKTGMISTVAGTGESGFSGDGGPASKAQFNRPHSLVVDDARQRIYVADIGNHRVRTIDLRTGIIDTMAGNGERTLPVDGQVGRENPLLGPRALALDKDRLWIALREGHSLWYFDLAEGTMHHATGDGRKGFSMTPIDSNRARFNGPKGIALTPDGNIVIVDTENHAIRLYSPSEHRVITVAGTGPDGGGFQERDADHDSSRWSRPHGVAVDKQGRIYVGDTVNHRVRQLTPPASVD